jgi:hypothetical protein
MKSKWSEVQVKVQRKAKPAVTSADAPKAAPATVPAPVTPDAAQPRR